MLIILLCWLGPFAPLQEEAGILEVNLDLIANKRLDGSTNWAF